MSKYVLWSYHNKTSHNEFLFPVQYSVNIEISSESSRLIYFISIVSDEKPIPASTSLTLRL